jgi:hypothetical protein
MSEHRLRIEKVSSAETDPQSVFDNMIQELDGLFSDLDKKFNTTYTEFENFINVTEPGLAEERKQLWSLIDVNVLELYLCGQLQDLEYRNWKNALQRWHDLTKMALQEFALKNFSQVLQAAPSNTILEIAA